MLVAEARYFRSWLVTVAAILVPLFGSVAIARAAHLSFWAGYALFFVMLCGGAFTAITLWLGSVRNRSTMEPAEPLARPARFAPIVIGLVSLILQSYGIAMALHNFKSFRWTQGGDMFAFTCLAFALTMVFTFREWHSVAANRSGPAPIPLYTQQRLAQLSAAHGQPTKVERSKALRPLRVRGLIRLGFFPLEAILLLSLAPRIGISLAVVSSFAIVGGIFLIGYKFFDL